MVVNIDNSIINRHIAEKLNKEDRDSYNYEYKGKTNMSIFNNSLEEITEGWADINYAGGKIRYFLSRNMKGSFNWGSGLWARHNGGFLNNSGSGVVSTVNPIEGSGSIVYWTFPKKDLWKKAKERSEKLLMNRDLSKTHYIVNHHE